MKTAREHVDELTATLYAAFLVEPGRRGMGGLTDHQLLQKARAAAWRIAHGPEPPKGQPSVAELMETTKDYLVPPHIDAVWSLQEWPGAAGLRIVLRSHLGTHWDPEGPLPPFGIPAEDFVRFYRHYFKWPEARVARFLGEAPPVADPARKLTEAEAALLRRAADHLRHYLQCSSFACDAGLRVAAQRLEEIAGGKGML